MGRGDGWVVTPYLLFSACAFWLLFILGGSEWPAGLTGCVADCLLLGIIIGCVFWAIFLIRADNNRRNLVNFDVSEAALTHFSLSANNTGSTLNYKLEVNLTVGPNKKKAVVYFESVQAWAYYQGLNFTSLSLPPFYLGGKGNHSSNSSTVVLQPLVFQGQQELVLLAYALKRYQQDEAAGRFSIDVTVSYLGFRGSAAPGHGHKLMGVKTFSFTQLPLPNAPSGWVEGVDSLQKGVASDIVAICVNASLFLCVLGCCCCFCIANGEEAEENPGFCLILTLCCAVPYLITIAILIPQIIRSQNKLNQVELKVSNAILTQFNLSSYAVNSSTLRYNLSLAVTVGPNYKKTGVYFDKLEATAYYEGQNFTSLALSPFYLQGRQGNGSRTVILRPVFQGQQVLTTLTGGDVLTKYQEETAARQLYSIVVTLSYWGIRVDNYDYNNPKSVNGTLTEAGGHKQLKGVATFELKVPLLSSAGGGPVSSGAAAVANILWLLVVIPVFLMLHFAFEV